MDWLKELLKKLSIADADVEKIDAEVRKTIPHHFVPKTQYNEIADAKKKLEKDVADRDTQLEDLKKTAGASDELKKQIETLQNENKTAKEKFDADLKELHLTNAIKSALTGKVHDESLVAGLFDKTKLVIDGDKVVGLDDQLNGIKESKAFLFKQESSEPGGFQKVGGTGGGGSGAATNEQLATIFGVAGTK